MSGCGLILELDGELRKVSGCGLSGTILELDGEEGEWVWPQ
jgi:hypothetical protein